MMNKPQNTISILLTSAFFGLLFCQQSSAASKTGSDSTVRVFQNGIAVSPDSNGIIHLKAADFSLRFVNKVYNASKNKFYATRVAAFLDESELAKINIGMRTENTACFEPGSGMAPSSNGFYESIIFDNSAHHYLYYKNSSDRRVNLISKEKNELTLDFPITAFYLNERDVKIKDTGLDKFYLAVFIDKNLNQLIEEGELIKINIYLE